MFPPLYVVIDEDLLDTPPDECAKLLAASGVELIQYRAKHLSARDYFHACARLANCLGSRNARFIVNDRPDIAAIIEASGVHVGQEDLAAEEARRICGPALWVGVSTHNLQQVREAALTSATYIAVGPIFTTPTKERPDPVVGVSFIREARRLTNKPIVAIGGITLEHVAEVYSAGADCVAVIRDILSTSDPAARAREFLNVAESFFSRRGTGTGIRGV